MIACAGRPPDHPKGVKSAIGYTRQIRHLGAPDALVHKAGVPTTAGRTAAIRQLVLETPAPVIADALGYHHVTTTRLASEAGGAWSRYASGDRTRSPAGWTPRGTGDS